MPLRRTFRGRPIKETRCRGANILVIFRSQPRGPPRPCAVVPLREYIAEVQVAFVPSRSPAPAAE